MEQKWNLTFQSAPAGLWYRIIGPVNQLTRQPFSPDLFEEKLVYFDIIKSPPRVANITREVFLTG